MQLHKCIKLLTYRYLRAKAGMIRWVGSDLILNESTLKSSSIIDHCAVVLPLQRDNKPGCSTGTIENKK